ncbi:MAG: hypothetical protein J6C91_03225 [Muribaculaceae bacterium]|nr:hypothetical protein [Muribaculaceae bacterium]
MEELLKQIKKESESMLRDATAQETNGNKAAGLRARKASLALEPMLKQFRKMSIARMKGLAGLILLVSLTGTACVSCERVGPTELTEENLPVKSIICGHVRYAPTGKTPTTADVGLDVNIFYGQKDENGNVNYALKTVKTRQTGYFETTLGCPVGQTLEVKVECRGQSNTDATEDSGTGKSDVRAYFHAEVSKTITCGTAAYFKMDMKPVAIHGGAGLVQP